MGINQKIIINDQTVFRLMRRSMSLKTFNRYYEITPELTMQLIANMRIREEGNTNRVLTDKEIIDLKIKSL